MSLIGRWAVCGSGRIGKIETQGTRLGAPVWSGTGMDGRSWTSAVPQVLRQTEGDRLESLLKTEIQMDKYEELL